nr:VIT family protein [Pediococcus inopinatus]
MVNGKERARSYSLTQKINVMRASVMGANDGILSVAGIVIGVAGATTNSFSIFISGIAGMIAGTVSMAMGEYVSVNTQRDSQQHTVQLEKEALEKHRAEEFAFVKQKIMNANVSETLAQKATEEMMEKDSLTTVVREKYGIDIHNYTNPYYAALASMIAFPTGSLLPLLAITFIPTDYKIILTVCAVVIALAITGYLAAMLGKAIRYKSVIRNVISGLITMIVTYLIGSLFA